MEEKACDAGRRRRDEGIFAPLLEGFHKYGRKGQA
jgi:hypothetical protein